MISLKEYINKELRIFEAAENMAYTEKELKELYNKYNKKFFDGELKDIPISYNRRSKEMGLFDSVYDKKEGKFKPYAIYLTSEYILNKNQIESILIHEMTHYWVLMKDQDEFRRTLHGKLFKKKIEEINTILKRENTGIKVSVNFEDFVTKFEKDVFALFIFDYKGKKAFIKCSPKSISKIGTGIVRNIKDYKGKSCDKLYLVRETDDDYFQVFAKARVFKSFYYFIKKEGDEAYERMMKIAEKVDLDASEFNVPDKIFA